MQNEHLLRIISDIKAMGFTEPEDILLYLPIKYHDFTETVERMRDGIGREDTVFMRLRTKANPDITAPNRQNKVGRATIKVTDGFETGIINVFGATFDWQDVVAGQDIYVTGKVTEWNGIPNIKSAKLVPFSKVNSVMAQYKAKSAIIDDKKREFSSEYICRCISIAFESLINKAVMKVCNFSETPEGDLLQKLNNNFCSIRDLIRALHFPASLNEVDSATETIRKIHGYKILNDVATVRSEYSEKSQIDLPISLVSELIKVVPFTLSEEQKRAIWHVIQSFNRPVVTQHLISGDVGCGKTIVYGIIAAASYLQGKQVTVLLPNLPLAAQVAKELKDTWPQIDLELIQEGAKYEYDNKNKKIIVGTTAILGWAKRNKEFSTDVFIVDEQQKVGTKQKNALIKDHTNIIEATATALPRTTMLALTGAYTISKIETPPVKKDIDSMIIYREDKASLFNMVKQTVANGNQVAILYPLKGESSSITLHIQTLGIVQFKIKFLKNYIEYIKRINLQGEDGIITISAKKYFAKNSNHLNYPVTSIDFSRDVLSTNVVEAFNLQNIIIKIEDRITDVTRAKDSWEEHFPNQTVMMHGGLKDEEKLEAVELAKHNKKPIIISSSMIEIGLTFPKLTLLIVIDPQNMGVSTLHQIRGRLVRHGGKGNFYMFLNKFKNDVSEEEIQRLQLLERFNKGSDLAEHDMLIRGFGDISKVGISQSGMSKSVFIGTKILPEDLLSVVN